MGGIPPLVFLLHSEHNQAFSVECAKGTPQEKGWPETSDCSGWAHSCACENVLPCSNPDRSFFSNLTTCAWPGDNLPAGFSTSTPWRTPRFLFAQVPQCSPSTSVCHSPTLSTHWHLVNWMRFHRVPPSSGYYSSCNYKRALIQADLLTSAFRWLQLPLFQQPLERGRFWGVGLSNWQSLGHLPK